MTDTTKPTERDAQRKADVADLERIVRRLRGHQERAGIRGDTATERLVWLAVEALEGRGRSQRSTAAAFAASPWRHGRHGLK